MIRRRRDRRHGEPADNNARREHLDGEPTIEPDPGGGRTVRVRPPLTPSTTTSD
ncbi:hypothetical protein [Streptomyces kaniharaensis]|uniref:hypothetical protein n=1 Tax=Streptomyces kaniharaensis TaxID=212423 RepID=UPI001296FEB2|nr:hypothetical protein [Streptomyces kaniharaensis]